MALVEAGKVSLDEPITKHFPDYPVGEFHITVGQLLDHTTGIKGYTEMPAFWEKSRLDLSHERTNWASTQASTTSAGTRYPSSSRMVS